VFTVQEKKYILDLAHRSIEHRLATGGVLKISEQDLPVRLKERLACFATLTLDNELRGCIGHIEAVQSLYLDVIQNAVAAAFEDPRFSPLTVDEFKKIKIEVSILSNPIPLDFVSSVDLLDKLRPNIDGVIIQKGRSGATYLPQVWDDLPDKKEFLSSLCLKAGLEPDEWTKPGMSVWTYQVEAIK